MWSAFLDYFSCGFFLIHLSFSLAMYYLLQSSFHPTIPFSWCTRGFSGPEGTSKRSAKGWKNKTWYSYFTDISLLQKKYFWMDCDSLCITWLIELIMQGITSVHTLYRLNRNWILSFPLGNCQLSRETVRRISLVSLTEDCHYHINPHWKSRIQL